MFPPLFPLIVVILSLALEGQPLINGSFEDGLSGWAVQSNPDNFSVDCVYHFDAEPVDGRCLLRAGLRTGTNELAQAIDLGGCRRPVLTFWWNYRNDSPNPAQDETWVSVNGVRVFHRWNGEAVPGWTRESVPLQGGGVLIVVVGTDVMPWRQRMTVVHYDDIAVSCLGHGLFLPAVFR